MKPGITHLSIISFIVLTSIVIAGCIAPSGKTSSPPVTISQASHPADFVITISKNGLGNVTSTIRRNLSEIQSRNFSEIPVLLDLKNSSYCGYSSASNYSAVADVALHDSRIQNMLIDGGIVKGIYVWGPPSFTKEQSEDPCAQFFVTLELDYRGKGVTALINESTGKVILPPEFS